MPRKPGRPRSRPNNDGADLPYRMALKRAKWGRPAFDPRKLLKEYRWIRNNSTPVQRYLFIVNVLKGELPFRMRNFFSKELLPAKGASDMDIDLAAGRLRQGKNPRGRE